MTTSPSQLAQLDDLTRRYARYSQNEAGLGSIWAGLCLAAVSGVVLVTDLLRYAHRPPDQLSLGFWKFLLRAPVPDPAPGILLAAVALPAAWLLGRHLIQRRVYERAGTVLGHEQGPDVAARQVFTVIEYVLASLFLGAQLLQLVIRGFPHEILPRALVTAILAAAPPLVGPRLASSLDRGAWLLLLLGSLAIVTSGFSESRLVSMLAYGVVGVFQAVAGLRAHWRFLDVRQALAEFTAAGDAGPKNPLATQREKITAR